MNDEILSRIIREGITEMVIFERRLERVEGRKIDLEHKLV